MLIPFKLQYRVDDVFQKFRPRDRSIFGDVSNDKHGNMGRFSKALQIPRTLPHLGNTSRSRFNVRRLQSLDGVDDDQIRF